MAGRISREQRREKVIKMLIDYKKDLEAFKVKLQKEYDKQLKQSIEDIIVSSIDSYYEYDTPYDSQRKYSLYDTYDIKINEDDFELSFSSKGIELKHKNKGDYLYEYMFGGGHLGDDDEDYKYGGWHGGDIKGAGHPEPGIPYLRKFKSINGNGSNGWLRRASRTDSPYMLINKNINDEIKLRSEIMQEEYDNFCDKRLLQIIKEIQKGI